MTLSTIRAGYLALAVTVVAAAACGKQAAGADDSLTRDLAAATKANGDLELAPQSNRAQMVVSAIEGGPTAAPKRASSAPRTNTPAPVRKKTQPVKTATATTRAAVEPAPAPAPERAEPAPSPAVEPPPLPPATQGPSSRQKGTYKTEAEIFRQMPWIKP